MRKDCTGFADRMRALAWLGGIAAVATIQQRIFDMPLWCGAVALVSVLLLLWRVAPRRPPPAADAGATWSWLAALAAFALGVFFRLRYLSSVPIGWGHESLAFVRFARYLADAGFPYEPYSWYAHTLYSYVIAVVMLVVPEELMALRIAAAAISLATIAVLFMAVRLLFGTRTAALALALVASSYWHLFATRNGYHQQLLPLFQGLFLYGLGLGLLRRQLDGWVIAAAAMVLGLHAHWGYYLMPVYWLVVCAYLYLLQRALWRRVARPAAIGAAIAALWSIPLLLFFVYNAHTVNYVLRGFSLNASAAPDLASKLGRNLSSLAWALSGNAHAPIEFATQVDPLVAAAALIGLVVSLRWFAASLPHALLVLLLAVNVAGLAVTVTNIFYLTATLLAVYSLAAIGLSTIAAASERAAPKLAPVLAIALVLLLGWQARRNYQEFFGDRIFSELKQPHRPPGTFFVLADAIRGSAGRRAVFMARDEPGRDFDAPMMDLGKEMESFAFMLALRPFHVELILFPPALIGAAQGVDIWVPNVAFVVNQWIPALRAFYPAMVVAPVLAPQPYAAKDASPVAYHLAIEHGDIAAYHGLREGAGFLYVAADGRYQFRAAAGVAGVLSIHGREISVDDSGAGSVLLEKGLHPLRLGSGLAGAAIELRGAAGEWRPLADHLLNANGHSAEELAPYLGRPGKAASFFYQLRLILPHPGDVRAVMVNADGSFVTAAADAMRWRAADGSVQHELAAAGSPWLLAASPSELLRVDDDGLWATVNAQKLTPRGSVGCEPVELMAQGEAAIVCRNGELHRLSGGLPRMALSAAAADAGLQVTDATRRGDDIFTTDEQSGRLRRFDQSGRLRDWRALAGIYYGSDVEADASGNLHVKCWVHGLRSYSADGHLLFNPTTDRPALFLRSAGLDADITPLHRLRFGGDYAIAIGVRDFVYTFQRVEVGTE